MIWSTKIRTYGSKFRNQFFMGFLSTLFHIIYNMGFDLIEEVIFIIVRHCGWCF
jgi:hypothetical protein